MTTTALLQEAASYQEQLVRTRRFLRKILLTRKPRRAIFVLQAV